MSVEKSPKSNKIKKTVMVVEDEQPLLNVIRDKLTQRGYSVVTTRTVRQAVDYINEIDGIDLIWLDHYLEGEENGLDLVIYLKDQSSAIHDIPIFLISNTSYPEKHQSYMVLGVEKYYTKSNFSLSQIIEDIDKYLRG